MKKIVLSAPLMVLVMIFGFQGAALCGAGPEGGEWCSTEDIPPATAGPYLVGAFSAAYDKGEGTDGHVNVHVTLTRYLKVHLFSFAAGFVPNLCALKPADLKEAFSRVPCIMGVQDAFGLSGWPVITNIQIFKKDFCKFDPNVDPPYPVDAMIEGTLTLRVVPYVPPPPVVPK
jgi:hypothetical protein